MNEQVAHFEARQQAQANQVTSFGNILTGVTNLYEAATGTQFQVFSGPQASYYANGAGVKIKSNLNPGNGFHQVQNLGPCTPPAGSTPLAVDAFPAGRQEIANG